MSKTATPRKVIPLILRQGFVLSRQRGSHAIYVLPSDQSMVIVPMHAKEISKGTLNRILKIIGLTIRDLK